MSPLVFLLACGPRVEPLDLPGDPAASGVPVGVRTQQYGGRAVEIWYPASDKTEGRPESLDFVDFVPAAVLDRIGALDLPPIATRAVRGAPVRRPETPYPVLVFSHGFGGNRVQSPDITAHLASRGYVVLATDHTGRTLGDLLPCLFSPPLEGCNLASNPDPGPGHVAGLVGLVEDLADDGFLEEAIDPENLGIFGHSAGGGTTSAVLDADPRFLAGLPMAGAGPVERDVPNLILAGDCDSIVTYDALEQAHADSPSSQLLTIEGAGHLAFSDLCDLDFEGLYDEHLAGRDDISASLAGLLVDLGIDGCPGHRPPIDGCGSRWLSLEVSHPIVRHYATSFFDAELRGQGSVADGVFPEAVLD